MTTLVGPSPDQMPVLARSGAHSPAWRNWFRDLRGRVLELPTSDVTPVLATTPTVVVRQSRVDQAAAIPNVPVFTAPTADLYRVTWHVHTTRPATVSSGWSFWLRWTDAGAACAFATATFTGNALTDKDTASWMVHVDAGTAILIETTYASVGATAMQYRLDVVVERMPVGP